MTPDEELIAAWATAARELRIEVRTAWTVGDITFPVLVLHFGSANGAIPLWLPDDDRYQAAARAGYFASQLNPELYRKFERQLFADTLDDWGWFGEDPAPTWYTGRPWS